MSDPEFRPASAVVGLLAGRWVIAILHEIKQNPKRHGELLAAINGVSEKVLTETLNIPP